jgi:hypothetical protein
MGSSWWPSSASNGRKASDEFAVPHEGLDFVATREFFPKTLAASIKQKARWVYGINFEAMCRLGWKGGPWDFYFFVRDRKGLITNFLPPLSLLLLGLLVPGSPRKSFRGGGAAMLPYPQMLARSPFAGTPVVHVGDEVCAGLLPHCFHALVLGSSAVISSY